MKSAPSRHESARKPGKRPFRAPQKVKRGPEIHQNAEIGRPSRWSQTQRPSFCGSPAHYEELAASHVASRTVDFPLLISEPNTLAGKNAFEPARWYVCIRGVTPRGTPSKVIPLATRIENLVSPPANAGQYDIVVIFQDSPKSTAVDGFDTRLCRNAKFRPLAI